MNAWFCVSDLKINCSVQANFMKMEEGSFSPIQNSSHIFWNLEVHYHVQKKPPLVPVLKQVSPVHNLLSYFLEPIQILSSHVYLSLPSGFFSFRFPHQNPVCIYLVAAMCHIALPPTSSPLISSS